MISRIGLRTRERRSPTWYFKLFLLVGIVLRFLPPSLASSDNSQLYESSRSHRPYVLFVGRDGVPGHAFVVLGEELDNGLKWDVGVFGFYPKEGKKVEIKQLINTPGKIDFKWVDLQRDVEYRVYVDDKEMKSVRVVLEKWKDSSYSLFDNNCSQMVSEVATSIGLLLPPGSKPGNAFPSAYIQALKSYNTGLPPSPPILRCVSPQRTKNPDCEENQPK